MEKGSDKNKKSFSDKVLSKSQKSIDRFGKLSIVFASVFLVILISVAVVLTVGNKSSSDTTKDSNNTNSTDNYSNPTTNNSNQNVNNTNNNSVNNNSVNKNVYSHGNKNTNNSSESDNVSQ
jgi:predicted PurR-regulated permease PerM